MNSHLSQSLLSTRTALSRALAPRQQQLLHCSSLASTASSRCCLLIPRQRNTYATAANAAAAAKAAAERSAPRSYTRAPTPPPAKTTEEQRALGYVVRRTSSAQLPVYRRLKSGNTREVIVIKRVDGDRRKMVEDIRAALDVAGGKIRINPTTQHIELSGDYLSQTQKWLLDTGF